MPSSSTATPDVNREVKARGKDVHWYRTDLETINEPARLLLEKYSRIPSDEVIPHVLKMVSHNLLAFARKILSCIQ